MSEGNIWQLTFLLSIRSYVESKRRLWMHKNRITEFLDDANPPEDLATFERFEYDAHAGLHCGEPDEWPGEGCIAVSERIVYDPYGQLPPFDLQASIPEHGYDGKYLFQG